MLPGEVRCPWTGGCGSTRGVRTCLPKAAHHLGRNPTPQGLQVSAAPPSTIPRSPQVKVSGEKLSFSHLREEQPLVSLASSGSEGDKLISSSLKEG